MICPNCGTDNSDDNKFCVNCGTDIRETGGLTTETLSDEGMAVARIAIKKIKTSTTLWTIVGISQIILGIFTICWGYGIITIAVGIWNLVQCSTRRKNIQYFSEQPCEMVSYYDKQTGITVVFLFVNLLLGAFIGVIGSIYDLTICDYIKKHSNDIRLTQSKEVVGEEASVSTGA